MRRTDDLYTPIEHHPYLAGMTREEFLKDLAVAHRLRSHSPRTSRRAVRDLLAMGPRAVRLVAYTIEEVICDRSATDYDSERQEDIAASIVQMVGRDAAPVLDDLATNGAANYGINGWAQVLLFEVLGLEGDARQQACHHGIKFPKRRGGKETWTCAFCGAGFGDGEHPTEGPAPARGPKKASRRAARR